MKHLICTLALILFSVSMYSQKTATGVITVVKGKIFSVKMDALETLPAKSDSCSISKDISETKNPFGIKITSGWLGIGNVVVSAVEKGMVTCKIVKETSEIIINGKKQEHFVPGKKVKLEWK